MPVVGYVFTSTRWPKWHAEDYPATWSPVYLRHPVSALRIAPGRDVLQSLVSLGTPPKQYVVRLFVDVDRRPPEVVTAYRSVKIAKYWRRDP
jgi:hypothetical protein